MLNETLSSILEKILAVIIIFYFYSKSAKYGLVICILCIVFFIVKSKIREPAKEGMAINIQIGNDNDDDNDSDDEYYGENNREYNDEGIFTAVIVEPRKHKALAFVLENFLENLDNRWNIILLHGNLNKQFSENIVENKLSIYKNRIKLINLNVDNLLVKEYSEMFFTERFYDFIPTEVFLIFQTDTIILKENKHKINKFIKYDYVGAPWVPTINGGGVGNGGLSLRRKSKMLELLKYKDLGIDNGKYNNLYGKYIAEDAFFNGQTTKNYVKIYKPNIKKASEFSVEGIYNSSPFGIHKCWNHLHADELNNLMDKNSDIQTLIKYNL